MNKSKLEVDSDLEEAVECLLNGLRDPKAMRQASERMDRLRKELRASQGEMEVAVELIRQGRQE